MNLLLEIAVAAVVGSTFLATLRVAVVGLKHLPNNRAARLISHDGWGAILILLLPWLLGAFARREVSPLPWIAFSSSYASHGVSDAIFMSLIVLVVDLWVLWIPAHSYVTNSPGLDRGTALLARLLNLAVGLLLMTPDNPIYGLLTLLPHTTSGGFEP